MQFVLTTLINEITGSQEDLILLIDDYHVIDRRSIHDGLGFLVENLPPLMHFIIATRTAPPTAIEPPEGPRGTDRSARHGAPFYVRRGN